MDGAPPIGQRLGVEGLPMKVQVEMV